MALMALTARKQTLINTYLIVTVGDAVRHTATCGGVVQEPGSRPRERNKKRNVNLCQQN